MQTKYNKEIEVNGHNIIALINTGSDFCLMRADQYIEIRSPLLEYKERFHGVGLGEN